MHPREFEAIAHPQLHGPGGGRVTVRWLGTAGYELTSGDTTLLIDPYLSRVDLLRLLTTPLRPDPAAIDRVVDRADAVLVGHTHFDHALDVPYIARKTGAVVYGSRSTANLMAAAGLPQAKVTALEPGRTTVFEVGPFKVHAIPSLHSPFFFGRQPFPGDIPCSCELPIRGHHYRCGDVFSFAIEVAGQTLYHLGSANLVEDTIGVRGVDLVLLCITARFATKGFVTRALRAVEPRIVMPMHYDNFFRALDRPLGLLPRTQFGEFVDEVERFDRHVIVQTLPLGGRLGLG